MQGCTWYADDKKQVCYNKYHDKKFDWCSKAKDQDKCLMFAGKGCAWYADDKKKVCFNKKMWKKAKRWQHKMSKRGLVDWCKKKFSTKEQCEKWDKKGCKWYADEKKQFCSNPKVAKKWEHIKNKIAKHDGCYTKLKTQADCEKWSAKGCKWYADEKKQVCYNPKMQKKMWKKVMKKMMRHHGRKHHRDRHHRGGPKVFMKNPVINVYNKFEDVNFGKMPQGEWNLSDSKREDPCASMKSEEDCTCGDR